jgi:transcriptional regulator with XRE-family HTH domain
VSAERVKALSDLGGQDAFVALAKRVKQLRYLKGWGPDELASRAKLSRTALYQIENGRTGQPRAGTVRRLARALGVDASELYNAGSPTPLVAARIPDLSLLGEEPPHFDSETESIRNLPSSPELSDEPGNAPSEIPAPDKVPPWLRTLDLERKFRRLLNSPLREAVSRIIEESYRLLPPEPFERND